MTMHRPAYTVTEAIEYLTSESAYALSPGDVVYVIQRHVSRSGMTRYLSLFAADVDDNGAPRMFDITGVAAAALGEKLSSEYHAIRVQGAGMDMHFHTVYRLSSVLFGGDGYALNKRTL